MSVFDGVLEEPSTAPATGGMFDDIPFTNAAGQSVVAAVGSPMPTAPGEEVEEVEEDEGRSAWEIGTDTLKTLGKGANALGRGVVEGANWLDEITSYEKSKNIPSQDRDETLTGKAFSAAGDFFKGNENYWETSKSEKLQDMRKVRDQDVAAATGFIDSAKAMASHPTALFDDLVGMAPELVAGGALAQSLKGLSAMGKVVAASGFSGFSEAGRTNADVKEQLFAMPDEQWANNPDFAELMSEGVPVEQAKREVSRDYANRVAAATAAAVTVTGVLPVMNQLNKIITGVAAKELVEQGFDNAILATAKGMTKGFVGEGAQESSSGAISDIAKNTAVGSVDGTTGIFDGVASNMGSNFVAGASMGGAAGSFTTLGTGAEKQRLADVETQRVQGEEEVVRQAEREAQAQAEQQDLNASAPTIDPRYERPAQDPVVPTDDSRFQRPEAEPEPEPLDTSELSRLDTLIQQRSDDYERAKGLSNLPVSGEIRSEFEEFYGEPFKEEPDANIGLEARRALLREKREQNRRLAEEKGVAPDKFIEERERVSADYQARRENQKAVVRTEQELDSLLTKREAEKLRLYGEPETETETEQPAPKTEESAVDSRFKRPEVPPTKKPEFVDQYWLQEDGEWITDENGEYIETDSKGVPLTQDEVESNRFINELAEKAEVQEQLDLEVEVAKIQKAAEAQKLASMPKSLNTRIADALGEINSVTAESQAKKPAQSTRDIQNENSEPSRNSTQAEQGRNQDIGQQEVSPTPGGITEAVDAKRNDQGNIPEARAEVEPDVRPTDVPPRSTASVGGTPNRGVRISDQPQNDIARAASEVERTRVRDTAARIGQKSNGRVELFETVDDLSPVQRKAVKSRSKTGDGKDVPAFYDPDTDRIYINPSMVKNEAQLRGLTAHEAVHAGLRDLYSNEDGVRAAMLDLLKVVGDSDFVKAKAKSLNIPVKQYMQDPQDATLDDVAALMEEIVARTAQGEVSGRNTDLKRIIGAIRDWLGRMGIDIPYLGADQADAAVIKTMRRAQAEYKRATNIGTYPPTIGQQAANSASHVESSRLKASIQSTHDLGQELDSEVPDNLAGLISKELKGESATQRKKVADRRLQYSLSPRGVFSKNKSKKARSKWKLRVQREMFPESIVGSVVADMKDLTEAQKNGDIAHVEFMLGRFNKVFNSLKLKGDQEVEIFKLLQAHMTDSVNPMISTRLQEAASRIREYEITSEDATKYMATRDYDSIPDSVRDAFAVLHDTGSEFKATDKAVAEAFVTGKIDPWVPKELIEPMQDMRAHIDNHSAKILEMVSDQISDRVARLNDEQWSNYQDYMGINSTQGRVHTNRVTGDEELHLNDDGSVNWDRLGETGVLPEHLVSLHKLHDTISGNMGKYLNTSYEAFESEDWYDHVMLDEAKMERAIATIKEQRDDDFKAKLNDEDFSLYQDYLEEGGESGDLPKHFLDHLVMISNKRIYDDIGAMLRDAQDANSMMNLFTDKSLYGTKDMTILKKKKALSPIIRELLGEYQDPRVNFVKSSSRMTNYIAKQEFLNGLAQELTGSVLFHTTDSTSDTNFHNAIGTRDADSMNPIAGMFTNVEFRDQLADWAKPAEPSAFHYYHVLNGAVKIGKTVYNPGTHAANVVSSGGIAMMNGHMNPKHFGLPLRMFAAEMLGDNPIGRIFTGPTKGSEGFKTFMDFKADLIRRGVLLDSVNAGDTKALMADMQTSQDTWFKRMMDTRMGSVLGWTDAKIKLMYQWEDDLFKMAGYLHEVAHNQKKRGMDEESAKITAAERIRNTYPTYSKIPPVVQKIRRMPLMGDFVSFSSEIVRITYNQKRYMEEDYKHDKGKVAMRVVGGAVAMSGLQVMAALSRIKHGIEEEDDETNRQLFAPWSKFGTIMYLGQDDNGNMRYIDLSRFDSWSMFRKMYNGATNGYNETVSSRLWEFAAQALEPFISPSMMASTIGDVAYNSRYSRAGLDIANKQDSMGSQIEKYGEYISRALAPGFLTSIQRFVKAKNGDTSFSGKQFKTEDELWGLVGVRMNTLNLPTAGVQQGGLLSTSIRGSNDIASAALRDQAIWTEEDITKSFNSMMKARDRNHFNALRMIEGFRKKGVDNDALLLQFTTGGNSKKNVLKLLRGEVPEYNLTDMTAANALVKAVMGAGNDEALIAQLTARFEFKRDLIRKLTEEYYADPKNGTTVKMQQLIEQGKFTPAPGAAPSNERPKRTKRATRPDRPTR